MTKDEVKGLFLLAGIDVLAMYELMNQYWPTNPTYYEMIIKNPWWLIQTKYGLIRVGWRKRVISIDWEGTPFRFKVTEDEVTKEDDMVHAWSIVKALDYLRNFRIQAETQLAVKAEEAKQAAIEQAQSTDLLVGSILSGSNS